MAPNYADAIKARVSMIDIAQAYGFETDRKNKILCPFHGDRKPSMQIYPGSRGYYCFSCGAGGDVISFVQNVYGLTFQDACKKIDLDFRLGLGIGEELDAKARKAAEKAAWERQKRLEAKKQKRMLAYSIYNAAYNRFTFLDMVKRDMAPKSIEDGISKEFAYACKHLDEAWQDVIDAADRLRALEEESE